MEGVIADLHIHSRFSRACSKELNLENLEKWARVKGLGLLGTGDFTHQIWLEELKKNLEEKNGILYSKTGFKFILSGEISLIYTDSSKSSTGSLTTRGRRVHLVMLAPSFEVVDKINEWLDTKGRRDYDGRPIFKISCEDFTAKMNLIDERIEVIPAHCILPNAFVHTKNGMKKIKNIEEGDKVFTHKNQWRGVNEVFVHPYNGLKYKIIPWCFSEGLETTSEHPFFAIKAYKCNWIKGLCKKSCSKLGECKDKRFEKYLLEWVPACKLEVGDFIVYPRFKNVNDVNSFESIRLDEDLCRLIGYFLAEGYTIRTEGIGFFFNTDESEYVLDVVSLVRQIFGKDKFKLDERKGKDIIFYSKSLNKFFSNFYNSNKKRAYSKKIPDFMLELDKSKQVEIFKGWWRGDKGYTVSRELMNQMKIICLRLGVIPSIRKDSINLFEKRGKHFIDNRKITANHDLYCFNNLSFFEDIFDLLKDKEFKKFKTKMSRRHGWFDDDNIYLPIRKIEKKKYVGDVYNLEVKKDNSYTCEFACVHNCWTPWFGVYGSESGFDSLKEAFGSQIDRIHAIETGMSSSPDMNWRISELNDKTIVSFSDSHSFWPWRIGREATIFLSVESYDEILDAIRSNKILGTVEVDPAYGKYHWDGHRNCGFSCSPEKTKELNGMCPKCGKGLIIGVENRVDELANQKVREGKRFYKLLPLHELISVALGMGMNSKRVWDVYNELIERFGNEFNVLLETEKDKLAKVVDDKIVELILINREGKIKVKPGYDGVYGEVVLQGEQLTLF